MGQAVSDVFLLVSRELLRLAETASSLQDQLSTRGYEDLDVEAFQNLDFLNQTLDCLASYLAQAGGLVPCTLVIEVGAAVDLVSLAALAERLRGHSATEARLATSEVELF